MGHYLGEMQTDRAVNEKARLARERRQRMIANISADLDTRGLAEVLASILEDPQMYRIRMRSHG